MPYCISCIGIALLHCESLCAFLLLLCFCISCHRRRIRMASLLYGCGNGLSNHIYQKIPFDTIHIWTLFPCCEYSECDESDFLSTWMTCHIESIGMAAPHNGTVECVATTHLSTWMFCRIARIETAFLRYGLEHDFAIWSCYNSILPSRHHFEHFTVLLQNNCELPHRNQLNPLRAQRAGLIDWDLPIRNYSAASSNAKNGTWTVHAFITGEEQTKLDLDWDWDCDCGDWLCEFGRD